MTDGPRYTHHHGDPIFIARIGEVDVYGYHGRSDVWCARWSSDVYSYAQFDANYFHGMRNAVHPDTILALRAFARLSAGCVMLED